MGIRIDTTGTGYAAPARRLLGILGDSSYYSLGVVFGADLCVLGGTKHPSCWEPLKNAAQGARSDGEPRSFTVTHVLAGFRSPRGTTDTHGASKYQRRRRTDPGKPDRRPGRRGHPEAMMSGTGLTVTGADEPDGSGSRWRRLTARRRWGIAAVALAAVIAGALAFWLGGGTGGALAANGPQATIARHGDVWLRGTIMQDGCDQSAAHIAIGDVGCSITVNGYEVRVVPGNIRLLHTPGTVTGLDTSANQTGKHADVYARLTGPHLATILSAPKYYARISS